MFVEVMADGMTAMVAMEPHATKLWVVPGELPEAYVPRLQQFIFVLFNDEKIIFLVL